MGMFDVIAGAIANPNTQGSNSQVASILGAVQQMAGQQQGMSAAATPALMSTVGSFVRSSLQEKRQTQGDNVVENLINQFAGTSPNTNAVQALFNQGQQQEVAGAVANKTGMTSQAVLAVLPLLVPLVLNLLKTGSSKAGAAATGNPVLSAFLDKDGDGDVDLGDLMSQASRFM
ncbi:MAG: DUF937 domain-containing protein [Synechococcales cyanobacterium RU_4_20]|nr:DUF937 domain-containing protein [Synechococcales cyanobacterium RU_4_20]NJR68050.1 DUF937 domain-containing protein [Synechococcales cyanobacterium CRU_2_2]